MLSGTFERRRSPAVSTRMTGRPSTSSSVSIASRVVPARSETITRSEPRKALTSEDFPALGRPITATRVGEAEPVQLGGQVLVLGPVDFVGDDEDRNVGGAQGAGQLGVAGAYPGAGV